MMCDRTITIKLVCSEDFSPHKIRGLKSNGTEKGLITPAV